MRKVDDLDPHTPVIVGVAQTTQRPDDLADAVEAVELMIQATRGAAADAGAAELLAGLDAIGVIAGAWSYSDPARLIARRVGADKAKTMLSAMGGNSPQSFLSQLALRIQDGTLESAVLVGGETIWSRRRQRAAGMKPTYTSQKDEAPDEIVGADVIMSTEFETDRGLAQPINLYPIFESAIRHHRGETLDAHRTRIAKLWERFNQVATGNPYAWSPTPMDADEIRTASATNRMVGYPYTKAMNSNWDLDQAAAVIICSVAKARSLGISEDRWVFPLAGTDAHDTYAVSERRDLFTSPAIEEAGKRLFELAGRTVDEVDHVDVYSCFPSAVQIAAEAIGLDDERQLTVTGGLPFAGGPLNNYVTHSIAAIVDVLRSDPGSLGLITANGGFLTKHALALYSTTPPPLGFRHADVQEAVDAVGSTDADTAYEGPCTIEAYTVMHSKTGPEEALVALQTPAGKRTWGRSSDRATMASLLSEEQIGAAAELRADGAFAIVA